MLGPPPDPKIAQAKYLSKGLACAALYGAAAYVLSQPVAAVCFHEWYGLCVLGFLTGATSIIWSDGSSSEEEEEED